MQIVFTLDTLFGTKARVALLRRLAREGVPLSARQLAELTGLTHRAVVAALDPLVAEGIVCRRTAGPAYQYTLQRDHAVVESLLLPALAAEESLPGLMTSELVTMLSPRAASIVLFGSAARGEHGTGSDVDVLVIPASTSDCEAVEALAEEDRARFFRRFGRSLSVHCVGRDHLAGPWPPFIAEAAREGVLLFGESLRALDPRGDQEADKTGIPS